MVHRRVTRAVQLDSGPGTVAEKSSNVVQRSDSLDRGGKAITFWPWLVRSISSNLLDTSRRKKAGCYHHIDKVDA